jgi:hypothetical protein
MDRQRYQQAKNTAPESAGFSAELAEIELLGHEKINATEAADPQIAAIG